MDVCEAPLFVPPPDARGWSQLHVGLSSTSSSLRDAAWPLFRALEQWLYATRRGGAVEHWFVRKPPALRLRLRGPGFDERARDQLEDLLRAHQEQGPVSSWGWATYEPEIPRLGGPVVLELVHTWFSHDTDAWLSWERLSRSGRARLGPQLMALALYGELLDRSLRASEEVWDVWQALWRIYDRDALPSIPPRPAGEARWLQPRACWTLASADEQALLRRTQPAIEAFAEDLARAHDRCTLVGGRRTLLGTLASFHFNLWCLRPQAIAELCRVAVRQLQPSLPLPPRTSMEVTP